MGLVTYASRAVERSRIRGLHDPGQPEGLIAIARAMEAALPGPQGGTNTGEAIERAIQMFADVKPGTGRDGGQRMIVLVSDGLANRAPGLDCYDYQREPRNPCWQYAVEMAREAWAQGIVVNTIALGAPDHWLQLEDIAEAGGHGLVLRAPTPEQLDETFDTLARSAQVALVN